MDSRKRFVFAAVFLILSGCSPKSVVRLRTGVIMHYGDIKVLARQDFLVTRIDLISQWETLRESIFRNPEVLAEKVKAGYEFNERLRAMDENIAEALEALLKQKDTPAATKATQTLRAHITESHALAGWEKKDKGYFLEQTNKIVTGMPYSRLDQIAGECENEYEVLIDAKIAADTWKAQLVRIRALRSNLAVEVEALTKDARNKLATLKSEKEAFIKESESAAQKKQMALEMAFNDKFRELLKNETVAAIKTNLSGEATLEVKKGRYFIFGLVSLADNKLMWNLPVSIDKSEEIVELSNDNIFSPSDSELFETLQRVLAADARQH